MSLEYFKRIPRRIKVEITIATMIGVLGGAYVLPRVGNRVKQTIENHVSNYIEERKFCNTFKSIRNSVDLSSLTLEERDWLKQIDKKDYSEMLKNDMKEKDPEIGYLGLIPRLVDPDNLTDKDIITIYRMLKPLGDLFSSHPHLF